MALNNLDPEDPEAVKHMQAFLGPGHVDQQIRQAIQLCWMALTPEKKTIGEVERQIRRIVDRALRDLREDAESFGIGGG